MPLTSALARSLRESLHTSLFIEVSCQGQVVYRDTRRVTLLPVDEWRDSDQDRMLLPSFVLPRDPAVAQVLAAAERQLATLADDQSAAFDGYQSIVDGAPDPYEAVDLQVRALWSALVHDLPLAYVNPPPTFSDVSQRLRSPSQVLAGRRGTCLDLALLFAACLEYVGLRPVLFLLDGHALPGYWRDEAEHERFRAVAGDVGSVPGVGGQRYAWFLERDAYPEVARYLRDDKLVPIETVALTRRAGFAAAVDEALARLRSRTEFESLSDVFIARRPPHHVTPLPLAESDE